MSAEEAAKIWVVQHRINEDALERLFEEGFNSLEAIKLIEADDLPESKISKGQRNLINDSVHKLNNALAGQTVDTAQYSSAASTPSLQHDNVHMKVKKPTMEIRSLAASQTATGGSQSATQTATGISQPANRTATGRCHPATQTATGTSQPASRTASGRSHPAIQTATGSSHPANENSKPSYQTVTRNSLIPQQVSPAEDPYLQARIQQLQSGKSNLPNMQLVNAGTLNLSGVNNSTLFQIGQTMNVPAMELWKDPQIYLSRIA